MNIDLITKARTFFQIYARFHIRNRWAILLVIIGISVYMAMQLNNLNTDTSNESFFVKDDPVLVQYNEFKDEFGSDEFVYILYETDDVLADSSLRMLKLLMSDLDTVKYVEEITSLLNVKHITSRADEILVDKLIKEIPLSDLIRDTIRKAAVSDKMIVDRLISKDCRVGGIYIKTSIIEQDGVYRKYITQTIRAITSDYSQKYNISFYPVGVPIMDHDLDILTGKETVKWGLVCFLLIAIFLFFILKHPINSIIPLIVAVIAILWTLGFKSIFLNPFSMLSIILPTLLIVICIGYSVHIINEFQLLFKSGDNRKDAIINSLEHTGLPCMLTSITTSCGFLSLMVMKIVPGKNLGIFAALGTFLAFILSISLIIVLLSFGKKYYTAKKSVRKVAKKSFYDHFLLNIYEYVAARRKFLIIIFILTSVIAIIGISKLDVDTNFLTFLSKSTQIRNDYDFVDKKFGGTSSLEIVLKSDTEDTFKQPDVLRELENFENFLLSKKNMVSGIFSINNLIKQLHKVVTDNRESSYIIPNSQELVSQLIMIYELSGGEELDEIINYDYSVARLSVSVYSKSSQEYKKFYEEIQEYIRATFQDDITFMITGSMPQFVKLSEYTIQSQIQSFSLAFVVILFLMILNFGSIKIGIVSMLPNVFPIIVTLGIMGYLGITLDFLTILIAAICIGIAVDDTIHFLNRFHYYFKKERNYLKALRFSLITSGRAILFTSIILTIGFSIFGFSVITILQKFGLLSALTIVLALLADFLVLPAFIITFNLFGKEKNNYNE